MLLNRFHVRNLFNYSFLLLCNQSHFQQQQTYQTPQQPAQQYQSQQYQSAQPQQYQPVDNFYRQPSPGVITLRRELPITQDRPLIYASEPAAYSFGGNLFNCSLNDQSLFWLIYYYFVFRSAK